MKIAMLIELLSKRNRDDEILVPCGPDTITDRIQVREIRVSSEIAGARRVLLVPDEGAWVGQGAIGWERVRQVPPPKGGVL